MNFYDFLKQISQLKGGLGVQSQSQPPLPMTQQTIYQKSIEPRHNILSPPPPSDAAISEIINLLNECVPMLNQAIHMFDFESYEMMVTNLLRQIGSKLGKVINLLGGNKGYVGTAFGRESQYVNATDRKSALQWMRNVIHSIIHILTVGQGGVESESWAKDLMDVLKTIEGLFLISEE